MSKRIKISDGTPNSKGFIISAKGVDTTSRFAHNPVMLDGHDPKVILGQMANLTVEGNDMFAEPVFNEGNAHAKSRKQEFESGNLKGASLGLRPVGQKFEAADFDFSGHTPVLIRSVLAEVSLTALPANPNALSLCEADGTPISDVIGLVQELKLSASTQSSINLHNMELSKMLAKKLGLSENATADEIATAVDTLRTESDALKLSVATARKSRVTAIIEQAVKDGKVKADAKDVFIKKAELSDDDEAFVKLSLEQMHAAKPAAPRLTAQIREGAKDVKLSDDSDRTGWDLGRWNKEDAIGLSEMESSDPEGYARLLSEFRNKVKIKTAK